MTPFGNPVVPDVYCILQTSCEFTHAARRRSSSSGVFTLRLFASSHVMHPFLRNPTVMTLRRNGRRRAWSGEPLFAFSSSGQSSPIIEL